MGSVSSEVDILLKSVYFSFFPLQDNIKKG